MLLVDDLAAGGTKNLRHTPRGLVTLLFVYLQSEVLTAFCMLKYCSLCRHTDWTDQIRYCSENKSTCILHSLMVDD